MIRSTRRCSEGKALYSTFSLSGCFDVQRLNLLIPPRSYSNMTSLQAFYPSSLNASSKDGGSDFVPLEILLDDRSESNDFARIVPQTDCQIQYDKFNQLRIRNRMQTEITASKAATNEHLRAKMVSSNEQPFFSPSCFEDHASSLLTCT
jgi:hypothetical protein